jgi:CelD/BcsL family acetyltransferase involved in cellulose biosynthesis
VADHSYLRVEVADNLQALIGLREDWLALEAASRSELPFQTWEWAVAWWTHLRADQLGVRDHLRVLALRMPSGELAGVAPMLLTERPAAGPVRARQLQFIGPDPNLTEIRKTLCLPGLQAVCQDTLSTYLRACSAAWDWIDWEHEDTLPSSVGDHSPARPGRSGYVLSLPATWDELKAGLRRNIKESLRKCYNSLDREGLSIRLEIVDTYADIDAAVSDFCRLHTARARVEGVPVHADVFESLRARAFLKDLCQRLAKRGVTRIFRLWVGNQLVSTRIGFELSGALYLYYSGWDPAFARYSVMTTLVAEIVRDAIQRDLRSVHLSTGTDVSKTRWGPREVRYVSRVEVAPRLSAQALHAAYDMACRMRNSRFLQDSKLPLLMRHRGSEARSLSS